MTAVNLTEADPADEDVDVEGVVVEEEPVEQGTAVFEIVESDHTAVVNAESAEEAPVDEAAAEQVVANELPEDEMGQVELDLDVAAEDEPCLLYTSLSAWEAIAPGHLARLLATWR